MKKFFIAALCVGLFVSVNSVSAQQNTKVQPKPKVENAVKKATATTTTPKACCADKQACCADKKACCDATAKAGDTKACCTTKLNDTKLSETKVTCGKVTTCSANKAVTANNKSSGKK